MRNNMKSEKEFVSERILELAQYIAECNNSAPADAPVALNRKVRDELEFYLKRLSSLDLGGPLTDIRTSVDTDSPQVTERQRRIYYQDIVYWVCNILDCIDGKLPGLGAGIVCGSPESPSNQVLDRMRALLQEVKQLRKE